MREVAIKQGKKVEAMEGEGELNPFARRPCEPRNMFDMSIQDPVAK